MTYHIKNWNRHFETHQTRRLVTMQWLALPTNVSNDGYLTLIDHPDGPAHFAVWIVMLQIAAKSKPRGTLMRTEHVPHDAASIARASRIPQAIVEAAVERLIAPDIAWVVADPAP